MIMKLEKEQKEEIKAEETKEKEKEKREKEKEKREKERNCLIWFLTATCLVLLLLLIGSFYLLYSCSEIREYFKEKYNVQVDDDEIKLQLYLLQSNYYLDEIEKEETKVSSAAKDYKMATRYATKREPNCVEQTAPRTSELKEYQNLEAMAENSIRYFRQILTNWNDNIDYMDIDKTLTYLLKQYQDIYFNPGDWKEEKIDKRWKKIKNFYDDAIYELEKCTIPYNIPQVELDKLQYIREQISSAEEELNEKLERFNSLNEELIKKVNKIIPANTRCLLNFPEKWSFIQHEEIVAEREIQVMKFKLKQIRYKLMIADTKQKFDYLVNWEENFSKTKNDRFKYKMDNHYDKAKKLQSNLLKFLSQCSGLE